MIIMNTSIQSLISAGVLHRPNLMLQISTGLRLCRRRLQNKASLRAAAELRMNGCLHGRLLPSATSHRFCFRQTSSSGTKLSSALPCRSVTETERACAYRPSSHTYSYRLDQSLNTSVDSDSFVDELDAFPLHDMLAQSQSGESGSLGLAADADGHTTEKRPTVTLTKKNAKPKRMADDWWKEQTDSNEIDIDELVVAHLKDQFAFQRGTICLVNPAPHATLPGKLAHLLADQQHHNQRAKLVLLQHRRNAMKHLQTEFKDNDDVRLLDYDLCRITSLHKRRENPFNEIFGHSDNVEQSLNDECCMIVLSAALHSEAIWFRSLAINRLSYLAGLDPVTSMFRWNQLKFVCLCSASAYLQFMINEKSSFSKLSKTSRPWAELFRLLFHVELMGDDGLIGIDADQFTFPAPPKAATDNALLQAGLSPERVYCVSVRAKDRQELELLGESGSLLGTHDHKAIDLVKYWFWIKCLSKQPIAASVLNSFCEMFPDKEEDELKDSIKQSMCEPDQTLKSLTQCDYASLYRTCVADLLEDPSIARAFTTNTQEQLMNMYYGDIASPVLPDDDH